MVNCSEFSPWCSCWQTVTNSVSHSADVCPSRCVWMKYISEVSSAEDRNTQILMWSASVYSHCAVCSWTCRVLKEQSSGCERNKTKFHTFLRRGIFNEFYRADRVEKSEAFFWTVMQLSNNEWNRHEHREASWECVTCWRPYNASNTHTHREKAFSPDSQQGSGSGNAMNICVNLLRDTDTHKNNDTNVHWIWRNQKNIQETLHVQRLKDMVMVFLMLLNVYYYMHAVYEWSHCDSLWFLMPS